MQSSRERRDFAKQTLGSLLTYSLLVRNGLNVSYEDVVNRFQDVYLGDDIGLVCENKNLCLYSRV